MNYPRANQAFTWVCFTFPPLLGSLVSFVWHGGAIWCVAEVVRGKRRLSPDRPALLVALLLYAFLAANLLSFLLNYTTIRGIADLVPLLTFAFFPFSYAIWTISRKEDIARAALAGAALASYGALVLAVYQFFILGERAEGGAGNALVFAQVTALGASLALAGALSFQQRHIGLLLGAYLAGIVAIVLSGSRSDWLVLVLDTAIVLFVYRREILRRFSRKFLLLAALTLVLIAVAASPYVWSRLSLLVQNWNSLEAHGNFRSSLGIRVALWEIGTGLFREAPIVGHGMHMTHKLIQSHMLDYGMNSSFSHFHNGILTLLVQSGLLGAICVLCVLIVAFVCGLRGARSDASLEQRFGATMLLVLVVTSLGAGVFNKLMGHDILDTTLMVYLIPGLFLACGTTRVTEV